MRLSQLYLELQLRVSEYLGIRVSEYLAGRRPQRIGLCDAKDARRY